MCKEQGADRVSGPKGEKVTGRRRVNKLDPSRFVFFIRCYMVKRPGE
jgi:hypothetical protein